MYNKPVPVLMYHSVGVPYKNWNFNYLTCPYANFEDHLKWIKNRGFNSVSLEYLYLYMKKGVQIIDDPIIITFDDGYSDNWVFAYPILKKFGLKAVIYVNPDFIENRKPKLNLEDVWENNVTLEELDNTGYLSWEELKIMEDSGLVDVQSHTMTHTWYPKSSKIIDFRYPNDPYLWMTWNENTKKKPDLQIDDLSLVNLGEPVYEHDRSIGVTKYLPDKDLDKYLIEFVKDKGGNEFFQKKNWKYRLFQITEEYLKDNRLEGHFESEEEYNERIGVELEESKRIIENKLNKEVKYLCWPGGSVSKRALELSHEIGYLSSTIGKDLINQRSNLKNIPGEDPSRINRIFPVLYWDGKENSESHIIYKNGFNLFLTLNYYKAGKIGSKIYLTVLIASQLKYKLRGDYFDR